MPIGYHTRYPDKSPHGQKPIGHKSTWTKLHRGRSKAHILCMNALISHIEACPVGFCPCGLLSYIHHTQATLLAMRGCFIGVGAQSTLVAKHFWTKTYVWKINKMPTFYRIIAKKVFPWILGPLLRLWAVLYTAQYISIRITHAPFMNSELRMSFSS